MCRRPSRATRSCGLRCARIGWRLAGEGGRCAVLSINTCNYMNDYTARATCCCTRSSMWSRCGKASRARIRGDEFEDAPTVEMVDVVMDHIGNFEGEHRVFNNTEVTRLATAASRRRTVAHQLAQHLVEHSWRTFPIAPWRC